MRFPTIVAAVLITSAAYAAAAEEQSHDEKLAHLNSLLLDEKYKEASNLEWLRKNCPDLRSVEKERGVKAWNSGGGYMPPVALMACDYADGIKK